jgi:hypothetical protein
VFGSNGPSASLSLGKFSSWIGSAVPIQTGSVAASLWPRRAVGSEEVIALPRPMPARRPGRGVDRSSKVHLVEAAGGRLGPEPQF